jgi:hypothetical protein
LPEGIVGRIGLAIWRKNPQVLYALIEHRENGGIFCGAELRTIVPDAIVTSRANSTFQGCCCAWTSSHHRTRGHEVSLRAGLFQRIEWPWQSLTSASQS